MESYLNSARSLLLRQSLVCCTKSPLVSLAKALRKGLSLAAYGFPQCTTPTLLWLSTKSNWLGLRKEGWHGYKKEANSILLGCKLACYIKLCLFSSFYIAGRLNSCAFLLKPKLKDTVDHDRRIMC